MKNRSVGKFGKKISVFGSSLSVIFITSLANPSAAATFEEQRKSVAASIETQPEQAIISLLQAGIKEGKSAQAIAETQKWLRQNLPKDAMLLYYAGQAAELSGDLKNSVVLYQQYLNNADLKSATADEAVYAVYTILLEQLNDISGAYDFGRNAGNRMMVCPRARQFDQWFLDEAVRRSDALAVSNRLQACIKAGIPHDLITARYSNYINWLFDQINIYVDQRGTTSITPELVTSYKELSKVMTFAGDMALRLDWAVSVIAYNQAKLAGKPATAPVAEAKALLEKYPQYAKWVQDGWAGGGNGQHYRGDITKYWPDEIDAKMAPVLAASEKLTPLQLAELFQSWREGFYNDRVVRPFEVKAVRQKYHFATYGDKLTARDGVLIFGKPYNEFTPEEAQLKVAQLANVNAPQASLIRAMAAGGAEKDLNKMIAALHGPEAWRLSSTDLDGRYADMLWHYAGKPGGNGVRDQKINESKAILARIKAETLTINAAPAQRLDKFRKLWADYRSPQPKIPAVHEQLKAIVKICPESIPELLRDPSPEAQLLARNAISEGITSSEPIWKDIENTNIVSVTKYAPGILSLAQRHGGNMEELKKRQPAKCVPHPLEAYLRKSVTDDLNGNKLQAWQVMAWINMQYPEGNAEQVKVMQQLFKSPAWNTMPYEVQNAARLWFTREAMSPAQIVWLDASDPTILCKDLLALQKDANVDTTVAALKSTIEGVKKSPVKIEIQGLLQLAALSDEVFSDPKVFSLVMAITDKRRVSNQNGAIVKRIYDHVSKLRDPLILQQTASCLWPYIGEIEPRSMFSPMSKLIESLIEDEPNTAYALARGGVEVLTNARNSYGFEPKKSIPEIKTLMGKSAMALGLVSIPVPRTDPAYPIYESQSSWLTGNEDSAWELCDEHWDQLIPIHRELTIPYLSWVLERVIYSRDETRQEELIKAFLDWAAEPTSPLTLEQKIQFELAYGDIAMQRGQLREAHQIYTKTRDNKAYEGVPARHQATLRKADAERIGKDFDAALITLGELELERIPEMWAPARYARAVVNYDMEEYDDANDDIQSILAREANHGEAKILLGKVQLKRKKLMEATEIEVTPGSSQASLVPGEKLKVTLIDPTLAVSGAGTEIEVVVWAKSGDKETFFLRQFGDQKTKFRGEVATVLGAPNPGDRVLQVIGDDEVYYAYSERFRAKMNNIPEKRGGPITIASNSTLMASSRKLLTEEEQRIADMEAQMESMKSRSENSTTEQELTAMAKAERAAEAGRKLIKGETLDSSDEELDKKKEAAVETRVKPGNPIHVRVIDHDRSRTSEIDELVVSVESSSGDSISRITLKETETHSGWFEGSIPTTGAQAMAYAQNSEPGRNPNMVLSPNAEYPAWRSVATAGVSPEFSVDLNDNIKLGEMTITAKEQGSKLKKFILFTGMNPNEMTPVAAFPKNQITLENPWQPSVTIMNDTDALHTGNGRKEFNLPEMEEHFNRGWMSQQFAQGVSANVAGPSEALPEALYKSIEWKRQNQHAVSSVIYRFQSYFYEPAEVERQFRLDLGNFQIPQNTHPSINHQPKFMLVVNGRPISNENGNLLEGTVKLEPGLHRFEIWAIGWVANLGFGRDVKLFTNLEAGKPLVNCPDSFFDSTKFPKGVLTKRNSTASIEANADGSEFLVKFAPDSSARLVKLVFIENEGPAPALNKISLSSPDGKKILPVAEDFATLNKNDTLEILTGDKISVRYVDDRYVTKALEKRERLLQVEFSTAEVDFADIKPRFDSRSNKDIPYFEKLLRFPYGEPLSVVINDADMDVSIEPDTLKVTVQSDSGGNREFIAKETGPSTGVFEAIILPVASSTSKENEMQVAEGEVLTAVYRDEENTSPGVPTDRYATIKHAAFNQPILSLSQPEVTQLDLTKDVANLPAYQALIEGFIPMDEWQIRTETESARKAREEGSGVIRPIWLLSHKLIPTTSPPEGGFQAVHGRRMFIELFAPHLALGTTSSITIYAQTDAGRKLAQVPLDGKNFDINVPGTIELPASLDTLDIRYDKVWRATPKIASYQENNYDFWSDNSALERFRVDMPLIAGHLPEIGVLSAEERYDLVQKARKNQIDYDDYNKLKVAGLVVLPGENIHIGVKYKDKSGADQWLTATSKVISHPVFDVMEEGYKEPKTTAYVGETIHLRVVDLGGDVSDQNDIVSVLMQAKSGAKHRVDLVETTSHSGVFKGSYQLSYIKAIDANKAADPKASEDEVKGEDKVEGEGAETNVRREGFPVNYDDAVAMRYTASNGLKTPTQIITISKGSDGTIRPFSKQYDDAEIAMRTQFSLAESYLELAKSHRLLGKTDMAALEYTNAKQLLATAMDQFKDPDTRSHAEYLLGTLSLEEADDTPEGEIKEDRYRAALSRFMNVVGTYPNTLHASKAQYRIATVYEKLKQPDIAAQEYVKLAYKHPDSEFLATAMAKLGSYFLRNAAAYEKEAKELLADTENKDAQFKGEAIQKLAESEYVKTAQIFGRLQQRFPSDPLAGKAGLRAGQSYMRAKKVDDALAAFMNVVNNEEYDGKTLRAEGMYWAGMCYQSLRQEMAAYSIYKRLTYDFPESKWAAYARGQLSIGSLRKLESELEIERLEEGR